MSGRADRDLIGEAGRCGPILKVDRWAGKPVSVIALNWYVPRRCSSAHCQSRANVVRVNCAQIRGWCSEHWPSFIDSDLVPPIVKVAP